MPTLRLPVDLGPEEKEIVKGDMIAAMDKQEEVEAEKKEVTAGYSKQIKELKTRVHALKTSLKTNSIEREVDVEDVEDLFAGKVRTIRKDTGECVKERALDPEERQMKLGDSVVEGGRPIDLASERRKRDLTEEQLAAMTPEEAEQMRADRLAAEAADAEPPTMPKVGDEVEVLPTGDTEWIRAKVTEEREKGFSALVGGHELIYDEVNYGDSWRHTPSWSDVVEASQEKARKDEIAKLAAEQAADAAKSPKALLKAPRGHKAKKNGAPKRISVQDDEGNEITTATPDPVPPTDPNALCMDDCAEPPPHVHTSDRVAF